LLSGCGRTVEFRPHDYEYFYQRRVLVLETSRIPPVPESALERAVDRIESEWMLSPHLGPVITRGAARDALAGDRIARFRYDQLSDLATSLGIAERELTLELSKVQPVDFVASIQLLHLPCPGCDKSDRLAITAQMFEVQYASLVWRASISRDLSGEADDAELDAATDQLVDDLLVIIDHQFKPKWQRLRFFRLKGEVPGESPGLEG
jgi:hypothetical protein